MEANYSASVLPALTSFCERHPDIQRLCGFLSKQIWNPADRQRLLDRLAELFLHSSCTHDIAILFSSFILEIAEKAKLTIANSNNSHGKHLEFYIALSKSLKFCPDLKRFTLQYLICTPVFKSHSSVDYEPEKKRIKKESQVSDLGIIQALWRFLQYLGYDAAVVTSLEPLLKFLTHDDRDVKWFAVQCVIRLMTMSSTQKDVFLSRYFSRNQQRQLTIKHCNREKSITHDCCCQFRTTTKVTVTKQSITEADFSASVMVEGILLRKFSDKSPFEPLVHVQSTRNHLRRLAMAVTSGSPVLLQGPVGSGKTSLVEHLAHLTGRDTSALVKLQLGDQTDCKALIGTYCSTSVPGEFVWRPGVLTQAVVRGHWVLLEDIDFAPMEVVSVLMPLLENNTLLFLVTETI
ncbi:hypothetical protein ScPMuIL_012322 [Solemya velum]